jgi:ASC-1-like (ASCH) protein
VINSTIVTGIWDLSRDSLSDGWGRKYDHYLNNFSKLLESLPEDVPLIVFGDIELEELVYSYRNKDNTKFYKHSKDDFKGNFFPFFDKVQEIRKKEEWLNQVGWLRESTQAKMEFYNPMVMSKMFLLHNAKIYNPFSTEYMFWLDGGITNTVHPGYFSHDKVLHKLENIVNKFLFVCFPYETTSEIHGFKIEAMNRFCDSNVNRVARGGFFGGHIDYLSEANNLYYSLLNDSLNQNLMGTEESIFTIMTYKDPETYHYETINNDGLINTFFEKLKNKQTDIEVKIQNDLRKQHSNNDVILYINAFNSPDQLEMVLDSFEQYDQDFLNKTTKILLNNSTKESLLEPYDNICDKYNFKEHFKYGNKGVCGSRQFAAEHFSDSGSRYMIFFEDDMLLDFNGLCKCGFNKNIPNLFNKLIKIIKNENYDFLKFSFSEFFGHNGDQWSWHNVNSENRVKYFGRIQKKPPTKFSCIKILDGVPYAEGEIYYSNWPHIIDQEGNQKCFLDTTWAHPFEQTWMSHIYSLTKEQKIKPAILLSSPITHNRVHFYEASERKES